MVRLCLSSRRISLKSHREKDVESLPCCSVDISLNADAVAMVPSFKQVSAFFLGLVIAVIVLSRKQI